MILARRRLVLHTRDRTYNMFITEYCVSWKGANPVWLAVLALLAVLTLTLFGVAVFVMVVLHRTPRRAAAPDARGKPVA
jgi:hypothetical protein